MTTINGFIRSSVAASRRVQRANQRHSREMAKIQKQQLKQEQLENALDAVQHYEDFINLITTVHARCSDNIDWTEIQAETVPIKPIYENTHEQTARRKLEEFRPTFFHKLFGTVAKKIKKLEGGIEADTKTDQKIYEQSLSEYTADLEEWQILQKLAKGVLSKDPLSYTEVIQYYNPFTDIGELGSKVNMNFEKDYVNADLIINSVEVIPAYTLKLTASGKLNKKDMPVSRFNELYQDYICSCILRIARELFAHIPVDYVIVSAVGNLLNTSTGYKEEQPILSVKIPLKTLESLNYETIDPSDSMSNFNHNMKFSKTAGFSPVQRLI